MKLKKWLKCLDPIVDVAIWTQYSKDDTPEYRGSLLNMPWIYLDYEIGIADVESKEKDKEAIYIADIVNEYGVTVPIINITLIET